MARHVDAIDLDLSPEEAFDYLADFSTTAEWDPVTRSTLPVALSGISSSTTITSGAL